MVSLSDEYKNIIINNKNITSIYTLDRRLFSKNNKDNIKINKLKKNYKNKIDYMICDVNGVNIDLNKVIYNTYNVISKKIIYYGIKDEYDVDRIIKKYERFSFTCNKKIYDNSFILEINTSKRNVKRLFLYKIKDLCVDLIEVIGNILFS